MKPLRLFDFLDTQAIALSEKPFLSAKKEGKSGKTWKSYSFVEVQREVNRMSHFLLSLGLQKDEKIAIISANCPEWNFIDLGAMQIGLIPIPLYPSISEKDYEFIFREAEIRYAFVDDAEILEKVIPLQGRIPSLEKIFSYTKLSSEVAELEEVLPKPEQINQDKIKERKSQISPNDLATIIYTSGTTGNPKGVMLTHTNIVSNIISVTHVLPFAEGKRALSFLPLCHSFERTVFYAYLYKGVHIHYAESLDTIGENLKEVKPHCFSTVPRLLEKVYEKIMAKGKELKGIKRFLFFWSINIAAQYKLGENLGWRYRIQLAIARKLVFSKWIEALGGNIQLIFTGAAAMQARLITLFSAAGVNIIEGYGLTETAPVLTVNRMEESEKCVGTVGYAIPGVDIMLAEDNEILAKGANIMKGYYKRPDLTSEVIDEKGWFHTGDIGTWISKNGILFLKITDRKKELFKTSGGKYVAPQVIENKVKESPFIEHILVIGEERKFVSALVVPSFPQLSHWLQEQHIHLTQSKEIIQNKFVIQLIHSEIERYNPEFGKWEQIKKITILPEEWTIAGGELTPTMKVKRKKVIEKYTEIIQKMYIEE